jgi:hypothetical protein
VLYVCQRCVALRGSAARSVRRRGEVLYGTVRYARVVVAGAGTVVPRDLCPVLAVEQRVIGGHALIRRLGQRLHERFLLFELLSVRLSQACLGKPSHFTQEVEK